MSRLKRLTVGAGISLALLSGVTGIWYQSHYVAPLAPAPARALPSPNGYDTLHQAMKLRVPQGVPYTCYSANQPLAVRQKFLAANLAAIARTREALKQEYLVSRAELPRRGFYPYMPYEGQRRMFLFATETYKDWGNLPESMRCALDTMEMGVVVRRGAELSVARQGFTSESRGRDAIRYLAGRVDAGTARYAAARLEKIEAQRWPLVENLREDLRLYNLAYALPLFKQGPAYTWEAQTLREAKTGSGSLSKTIEALYLRAAIVYNGPKSLMDSSAAWLKALEERSWLSWSLQRAQPIDVWDPYEIFGAYQYPVMELDEYFRRTQSVLLRTHLAMRAYQLENGRSPESLAQLVAAGYLKTIPLDPFSPVGAPLRYQPGGKLWSVGPDAKDNGGKPIRTMLWEEGTNYMTGDVVARINSN